MTAPLNYTTKIAVGQSVGEVQQLLAGHGARQIAMDYDDGRPCGVSFTLHTPHGIAVFTLPVDVEAMQRLLAAKNRAGDLRDHGKRADRDSRAQAERVAWRVIKDWLAAQMTLVDAQMVQLDEVMLPYLAVEQGRTLYQMYQEVDLRAAIGAGR